MSVLLWKWSVMALRNVLMDQTNWGALLNASRVAVIIFNALVAIAFPNCGDAMEK